jgi:hypothetical protein
MSKIEIIKSNRLHWLDIYLGSAEKLRPQFLD